MIADKHTRIMLFINKYDLFHSAELNDEYINSKNYQQKINKFIYAVIQIHLDIVFAIERFN